MIKHIIAALMLSFISFSAYALNINQYKTPEAYVEEAKKNFNANKWNEGKAILERGLKYYSQDSDIWFQLGRYYYHFNDYEKARYNLTKAVDISYGNLEAKYLLVNIEDRTGEYSSAICHINEILEAQPYRKELWMRKADLYRKLGNYDQSERIYKRLIRIFPKDSTIIKDYFYSIETSYYQNTKDGNLEKATERMEELSHNSPGNLEYDIALINLYLQLGQREKALEIADRGLFSHPGNSTLVQKKIGILTSMKRYPEALSYFDEMLRTDRSPMNLKRYSDLLEESTISAKENDPYVLYGKLYENTKSADALNYLLSTSLSKGYEDDARYYLKEAKKKFGETPELLYKEYKLDKKTGNEKKAYGILTHIHEMDPENYDAAYELGYYHLNEAIQSILQKQWLEAIGHLQFVTNNKFVEPQAKLSAYDKMITCYGQLKKNKEGMNLLDSLYEANFPGLEKKYYIDTKASLLVDNDEKDAALSLYEKAISEENSDSEKRSYLDSYEEIAIPYIGELNRNGFIYKANSTARHLVEIFPSSDLGIRYVINTADALGRQEEYALYVSKGYGQFPNMLFYKIKEAGLLDKQNRHLEAVNILRPYLNNDMETAEVVKAHSASSGHLASDLLKIHKADSALAVIDSALRYDLTNKDLKYAKGLAFEQTRQYDSAYFYQSKFFQPSPVEFPDFNQHIRGLASKAFKNEVSLDYIHTRIGDDAGTQTFSSIATFEYSRSEKNDSYTARLFYKGAEGNYRTALSNQEDSLSGGYGIQLQAQWDHRFGKRISSYLCAGWSDRYFSQYTANIGAAASLNDGWETGIKLGYRRIRGMGIYRNGNDSIAENTGKGNLWILSPSVSKTAGAFVANAQLDLFRLERQTYYNINCKGRLFLLPDGQSCVTALAGIGSFPEITIFDLSLLQNVSHTNTMVGFDAQWLLTKNAAIGFTFTWFNHYAPYYDENGKLNPSYKNLYNADIQLHIHF